jgi:capsular polysaccharide biosynthesis protein
MNNQYHIIEFFGIVWKRRKPLSIICIAAIIASIVITDPHIMKPYYESTCLFYPLNPNITSSASLFNGSQQGFFGAKDDAERILAVANSIPLKAYIVRRFNLFQHYKIDSNKTRYPLYKVMDELEDNYTVSKDDKGAIKINVQDHDRQIAAEMSNEIVSQIDLINQKIYDENRKKVLMIYERKLEGKKIELNILSDSILNLERKFYFNSRIENSNQLANRSRYTRNEYNAASERTRALYDRKSASLREYDNLTALYDQYKSTIDKDVSTIYLLEKASPAEKKVSPTRWLIIICAALISFFIGSYAVVSITRYKVKNVAS